MQKRVSFLFGLTLILLGVLALIGNLVIRAAGKASLLGVHAWPIFVVGAGLLFCIPPFLYRQNRGLSGLFIPGLPVLVTGLLLFAASLSGDWSLWARFWPLEVLAVALGFVGMAFFLRIPWLAIPASIIGSTGLVLQFCAATGLWAAWAVLWSVVLLGVGLPLLVIGAVKKMEGVRLAGMILTGLAVVSFAVLASLLGTLGWVSGVVGPLVVLALGAYLLVSALRRKKEHEEVPPAA